MAVRQGYQEKGNKNSNTRGNNKNPKAKASRNSNKRRRQLYSGNEEYREKAKQRSRDTYRKKNPKKEKVDKSDSVSPKTKEVHTDGIENPIFTEVLTIPESAKYLGKSVITFKRWISDRLLPPPILACTSYGYMHYSIGELQMIAKILRDHDKNYEYLHHTHECTINQLWQGLEAYRRTKF